MRFPTRRIWSRFSTLSPNWFKRLTVLTFSCGMLFAAVAPHAASAQSVRVDRRVDALPAAALLHDPPQLLVDRRRQAVSRSLRTFTRPLFLFWAFSQIAAFVYLWASGSAARMREWLRRRIRPTPLLRFAYGAALAGCAAAAAFPANLALYRVDVTFALTSQPPLGWLRDGLVNLAVAAVSIGLIVTVVFWLVDRSRIWYAYASLGLFGATLLMAFLEPLVLAPLFNRFTPLTPRSAVYAPLRRLEAKAGVGGAPIYVANESQRTPVPVAEVAGFGPTKRIVLGDTLLESSTLPEVLFVTAREFGHYAHADGFRLSLFWTFLFIFCTGAGVIAADRVRFRRDDDPLARLALVLAFMGLAGLAATPVYNGYSRNLEGRADRYALALTHDRAAAARAFIRTADKALLPLCASRPILLYFYNSPPLGTRIAAATGQRDPCRT